MQALREIILSNPSAALALLGLAIGFGFGALAAATNFCVMGAISDWHTFGDKGRLGAVALAAATAIAGAQSLHHTGSIDLARSMYLSHRINWAGALCGGLIFGFGMVLAGGCASRNLVRAGGGDIRAMLTLLVLSLTAFATISGILAPFRNWLDMTSALDTGPMGLAGQSLADAAAGLGVASTPARLIASLGLIVPLVWFALGPAQVFSSSGNLAAGIGAGLLVVAGWLVTGLAFDDMAVRPVTPTSLSFVRPVADALDWLEHSTALGIPGFGAATVFGVLLGSCMTALSRGRLAVTGFANRDDLSRHLRGALMMGAGGVLGLGCSIGQGITGLSTLAIQSVIAASAIIAGAILALRHLERQL